MENGNEKDLDELLKVTLSKVEKPSIYLNYEVKRNLRKIEENKKQISVWWLPGIGTIIISLIISIGTYLFIENGIIKTIIIWVSLLLSITVIILTIIGLKYFGLKEGAVLK